MSNYDIIIVGAGTAGSVLAAGLATQGIKAALFDRLEKEKIGIKVCGDATSIDHFERIRSIVKIDPPHGEEIQQKVEGAWIYSPDRKVKFELVEEGSTGVIIDRFKLGMRILDNAIDYGAELYDSSMVKDPIIKDDQVKGIKYRGKDNNLHEISAKVVVDASGVGAVLRKKLDKNKTHMDHELAPKDVCNCYREIRDVKEEIESPGFIRLMFDQDIAAGGYIWEFPRGSNSMNVGLGVMRMNKLNPHRQFDLFLKQQEKLYRDSKLIHGGAWRVPLRRPQDNLVWNGFMLIGDSGTQVKPTDGGGIGISVTAAAMATKTITSALEFDDVSMKGLWPYSVEFMTTIAPVTAPLAILKDYFITLPSATINEVFHKRVVEGEELLYGNAKGQIDSGLIKNLQRAYRGRRILGTLLGFRSAINKSNKARNLYYDYPKTPDAFPAWRNEILNTYGEL
ncbi:MAG: geranylgeranyl reductase family protein [Candidatus Heimdallarchaeota archaeon]|nr:geranylgeranyl reductase family protein [Candidatus Heimdallarchaeota archaeon]